LKPQGDAVAVRTGCQKPENVTAVGLDVTRESDVDECTPPSLRSDPRAGSGPLSRALRRSGTCVWLGSSTTRVMGRCQATLTTQRRRI
jgi:hypothetical protein